MKCPLLMAPGHKLKLREDTYYANTDETGNKTQRRGLKESWNITE